MEMDRKGTGSQHTKLMSEVTSGEVQGAGGGGSREPPAPCGIPGLFLCSFACFTMGMCN